MPSLHEPTENDEMFDRSQYKILLQAKTAWEEIRHFRDKRSRNRNYTFGKQWNDKITLPDGRTITEEQYLREQGKVPLKNNMIRQLVKSVLGQFRSAYRPNRSASPATAKNKPSANWSAQPFNMPTNTTG